MHTSLFRVRQYECDAYGHLNNVNYVRYLQDAIAGGWTRQRITPWRGPPRWGGAGRRGRWTSNTSDRCATATRWNCWFPCPVRRICATGLRVSAGRVGDLVAQATVEAVPVDAVSGQAVELPQTVSNEQPDPAAALPVLPPSPPGVFSVRHRVTWGDLDMSRQVGDATLLSYVETCGFGVIAAHHWPAARMVAQGFAIILRRHQIENLASAALDDELEIATWVSNVQRASATRHYTIRRVADGTLLTRVDTLGVWVDLMSGRPIRIPPDFLADFAPNLVG